MMGKTAFISMSFQHREELAPAINKITDVLRSFDVDAKIFVNDYAFEAGEEAQMMEVACQEIAQCDLLIAEVSHKAIGVGVEVGYAVGLGKPVIYIRQHHLFHTRGSGTTAH
jgi:nucleoside 2-deoxyribosyltransferase